MLSRADINYIQKVFKKGKISCLTGAGISAESGIPTFRGEGGLWEKYDPQIFADSQGLLSLFRRQPEKLIDFVLEFYAVLLKANPNPAHLALAALEKGGILDGLITQNIDNLHQRSGSRKVVELHGNAFRIRCTGCGRKITLEKDRLAELMQLLKIHQYSRIKLLKVLSRYFPRCAHCRSRYRIDIVLFKEMLPQDELSGAHTYLDQCQTLLVVGSSLEIFPAAALPIYAKERGARLLEINNQASSLSDLCDYRIRGNAAEILPEIVALISS